MTALEPCRCCGTTWEDTQKDYTTGRAVRKLTFSTTLSEDLGTKWQVHCRCGTSGPWGETKESAVIQWNAMSDVPLITIGKRLAVALQQADINMESANIGPDYAGLLAEAHEIGWLP